MPTNLIVIDKDEYDALAKELAQAHLINLKYQANCKCKIDLSDITKQTRLDNDL
tara:strand:+ start:240 stop:401 length:162 start_codon:yes stop_codon:yes gene_type:complete